MAKGTINKAMLIGRLGADPEVRYMPNGNAVVNLSLATNDGYKDRQTGQFVENTEWHRVVVFGRLAEIAGEYLKKGRMVFIEGRIRTNKWKDQSGQDRYTTEIVANEMQLLGGRGDADQGGNMSQDTAFDQTQPAASASKSAPKAKPAAATEKAAPAGQAFDDDIPF